MSYIKMSGIFSSENNGIIPENGFHDLMCIGYPGIICMKALTKRQIMLFDFDAHIEHDKNL